MASIHKSYFVDAPADAAWDAIRDFYAVDERVATGFVRACEREEDARVVTFANGTSARELLVTLDDERRRLVYAVADSPRLPHHNASFEVQPEGNGCRITWVADILPDALAPYIEQQMDLGCAASKETLERHAERAR
ncbi:MAG: SRPBCC family protein [Hyphomicrobiales bacterium]